MSQIAAKTYEPAPARKVAFLGLGVMGYPMAGHLARAGHHVTVYNRSAAKASAWMAECPGNASAPTPREAAAGADIVFACVGNDDDLRAVTLGADGAFAGMAPGAVFVDADRDLVAAEQRFLSGFGTVVRKENALVHGSPLALCRDEATLSPCRGGVKRDASGAGGRFGLRPARLAPRSHNRLMQNP